MTASCGMATLPGAASSGIGWDAVLHKLLRSCTIAAALAACTAPNPDYDPYFAMRHPDASISADLAQPLDASELHDLCDDAAHDLTAPLDFARPPDLTRVADLTLPVDMTQVPDLAGCGTNASACCPQSLCCSDPSCDPHIVPGKLTLACTMNPWGGPGSSWCTLCGSSGYPCCPGNECLESGTVAIVDQSTCQCQKCGTAAGLPCCNGQCFGTDQRTGIPLSCMPSGALGTTSPVCGAATGGCGGAYQACCPGNTCLSPDYGCRTQPDGLCIQTCGGFMQPCCKKQQACNNSNNHCDAATSTCVF